MSHLTDNLTALGVRLVGTLPEQVPADSRYVLLPTTTGVPTMVYHSVDGDILVHSKYDPQREAVRLVDAARIEEANIIIVYGFGLGYHVTEVARRLKPYQQLLVIEPDGEAGHLALTARNMAEILANEQIHLAVALDAEKITAWFLSHYDPQRDRQLTFLRLPALDRLHGEYFAQMDEAIRDAVNSRAMEEFTLQKIGPDVVKASLFNLRHFINNPGTAALHGQFTGLPAIIVAAGPSLNKNVHLLRQAKGRAVIIAVGTAVKTVQAVRVEPDIVISIDPGMPNYNIFHPLKLQDSVLVADLQSHPGILDEFDGCKYMFTNIGNYVYHWIKDFFTGNHSFLETGGSVANNAWSLAYRMGCDPIVCIGQDLCLGTGGRTHADGTVYEGVTANDRGALLVEANDGGKVKTLSNWYQFLRWFEAWIEHNPDRTYINATEGGARIRGMKVRPLAEVITTYCTGDIAVGAKLRDIVAAWRPAVTADEVAAVLQAKVRDMQRLRRDIKKARDILAGLESSAASLPNRVRQKRIKQLRRLNAALDRDPLFSLLQEMDYGTVRTTMHKTHAGLQSDDDSFDAAAGDTVAYYQAMADAAKEFLALLAEAQQRLTGEVKQQWA